jgi:hypothetical protein
MARWDGMFPLFNVYDDTERIPLFKESVEYVQSLRSDTSKPFDIIRMGATPGESDEETKLVIQSAKDVGSTWWLELLMPEIYGFDPEQSEAFTVLRERVLLGPPDD